VPFTKRIAEALATAPSSMNATGARSEIGSDSTHEGPWPPHSHHCRAEMPVIDVSLVDLAGAIFLCLSVLQYI
jgi:hypothetical protein